MLKQIRKQTNKHNGSSKAIYAKSWKPSETIESIITLLKRENVNKRSRII